LLYALYDLQHAASIPLHIAAEATLAAFRNPFVPASYTPVGRTIAASAELTERATRRFAKPEFGLRTTVIGGAPVPVREATVAVKPFCRLKRFERDAAPEDDRRFVPREGDPRLLIVAPLSGHHATLLRGTVEALLPNHDVYITDWVDARDVPAARGRFGLAEYIDYVMDFLRLLGPGVHVLAVCQPTVPVLAATALMAAADDPAQPVTMTLMGGPIDPRAASTEVTALAEGKPLSWFESRVVHQVPPWHAGAFRRVYPGFIQLASFMSMNADRHVDAHFKLFQQVVTGDGGSADKHRRFYDEYLAVLDLPADTLSA
jgi:poly(3-hydroxybutyrate) depolymerase